MIEFEVLAIKTDMNELHVIFLLKNRTSTGTTYGGQGMPMNIGKTKNNYDKEGRPKCFNCNKYRHIAKECWKKKKRNPKKYFKCERVGHIAKDCKEKQLMKIRSIKEESDNKDKEKSFGKDSK